MLKIARNTLRSTPGHSLEGDVTVFIEKMQGALQARVHPVSNAILRYSEVVFHGIVFPSVHICEHMKSCAVSVCILIQLCEFTCPWCSELIEQPREKSSV